MQLHKKALLLNFIQNDFFAFGAMEVQDLEKIVLGINKILTDYDFVILNQLCLEADDIHFAANYPFYKPGQIKKMAGKEIFLRPIFCVKDSFGAEIPAALNSEKINLFIKSDMNGITNESIAQIIRENIKTVSICGLDIGQFVLNATEKLKKEGIEILIISELLAAID